MQFLLHFIMLHLLLLQLLGNGLELLLINLQRLFDVLQLSLFAFDLQRSFRQILRFFAQTFKRSFPDILLQFLVIGTAFLYRLFNHGQTRLFVLHLLQKLVIFHIRFLQQFILLLQLLLNVGEITLHALLILLRQFLSLLVNIRDDVLDSRQLLVLQLYPCIDFAIFIVAFFNLLLEFTQFLMFAFQLVLFQQHSLIQPHFSVLFLQIVFV
mmetsp:Transcript_52548/g.83679  ORF Transcript_52548/g.83679 Transcript_52548/m.83679 type:complete len:211 (+) Transcript_52548:951-1583(+)